MGFVLRIGGKWYNMCNSQHFLRIHTVPHGITPVFLFLYMCQSRSLCRRLEECSMIEIRLNALGNLAWNYIRIMEIHDEENVNNFSVQILSLPDMFLQ